MSFFGRYPVSGSGGGGGGGGTPYQEVPSGTINGVNTTFTVSTTPNSAAAFSLYQDGLILIQGVDYTLAGTTITMATAPLFGQTLYAVYTVLSGGGGGVVTAIADTDSIDLTLSSGTLTADFIYSVQGTRNAPIAITAGGGIPFTGTGYLNTVFVEGSGGPVTVTANPRIAAGTTVGQLLKVIFRSDTNTLTLNDGNGLDLNGPITGGSNNAILLEWDGSFWFEIARRQ